MTAEFANHHSIENHFAHILPDEEIANLLQRARSEEKYSPNAIDTVGQYLNQIKEYPMLSSAEIKDLIVKAQNSVDGDTKARDLITVSNLRLVISIAKKYQYRGVPFLDLIQEGNIALMKQAIDKFDVSRGFEFSTYATYWIRQRVSRYVIEQGRTIRVPVNGVEKIGRMHKFAEKHKELTGEEPTDEEIAQNLGLRKSNIPNLKRASQRVLSLNLPVNKVEGDEFGDFIQDTNITPDIEFENISLREEIENALEQLNPREQSIMRLRFGLDSGQSMTLDEIAKLYNLTRERIRQLEKGALNKMRNMPSVKNLAIYITDSEV